MTVAAKTTLGAALWMVASGGTLIKVAELITVNPPKLSRETMDATTHDSPGAAMEVIAAGIYDPGEVTGQIHYIAGSAGDLAFLAAAIGGLQDFKCVVKGAAATQDITFSGFVTAYGPDDMPTSGKQTASFSIKVSGPRAQGASV